MKKNFTILMLLAFCCLGLNAKTVTDVLTPTSMGLSSGWEEINGITIKDGSSAQYNVLLSKLSYDDAFYFRKTETSTNTGIVTSKSGGVVSKIIVSWSQQASTSSSDNTILIYGSDDPFGRPSDLFPLSDGSSIGTIVYGNTEFDLSKLEKTYKHIGIRSKRGAVYFYSITIVWEAEDEPVTFTPAAGEVKAGTEVAMECEEGAEIYYTVDGSTPTTSSTLYTEPIVINEDVVIKAISCKDDVVSKVVTAEYTVIPFITSLAELANKSDGYRFQMGIDLTVVYCNYYFNYVYDGTSYGLLYQYDYYLQPGDVIEAGWMGKNKITYEGRPQLIPESALVYGEKTAAIPEPKVVTNADEVNTANVNQYYKLKHVYINQWYIDNDYTYYGYDYDGLMGIKFFTLNSGTFWISPSEGGTYDITGFVDVYDGNAEFHPTVFAQPCDVVKFDGPLMATYCSNYDLDFTNVTDVIAYRAYDYTGDAVKFTKIDGKVPAGTGLLLEVKENGTYKIPNIVNDGEIDDIDDIETYMEGTEVATIVYPTSDGFTNYIFAYHKNNYADVAFHAIADQFTLPAGKAYLALPTTAGATPKPNAPMKIVFDDEEATGIEAVNCEEVESGDAYNLQGIKVDSNYKGCVIKNGKKFYNR